MWVALYFLWWWLFLVSCCTQADDTAAADAVKVNFFYWWCIRIEFPLKDGEAVDIDIGQGGKEGMVEHRSHMAKACHGDDGY